MSDTTAEQCHAAAPKAGPDVAAIQAVLARQALHAVKQTSASLQAPAPRVAPALPAVHTEPAAQAVLSEHASPALRRASSSSAGALLGCEQGVVPPDTPRCLSGRPAPASSMAPLMPAVQAAAACSTAGAAPAAPCVGSGQACSAASGLSGDISVGASAARAASRAQVHTGHVVGFECQVIA